MNCPITSLNWMEVQENPHDTFARHRANHWYAPIAGSQMIEVLSYEGVRELLAGDDRLHEFILGFFDDVVRANPAIDPDLAAEVMSGAEVALVNMDGEAHHRLRAAVSRAFTPKSVAALRPELNTLANDLAAQLVPGEDFVASFARELPARALCLLTGIPGEDHERFAAWIDVLHSLLSTDDLKRMTREESEALLAAHREMNAYTLALVEARREKPQDDLVSRLTADDAGLDDATVARLVSDLIFAGNDTTRKALASMVLALSEMPVVWEGVAREPGRGPAVVDETLRLYGPAPGPMRRAVRYFTHKGESFDEGQVAALSIWSANRDEAFWGEDASSFDPGRANLGQHLAFGHGPHFCLGASLAREEMLAALLALTRQLTNITVLEPPKMPPVGSIYGPLSLRIDFDRR